MGENDLTSTLVSSGLIVLLTALGIGLIQFAGRRVINLIRSSEYISDTREQQLVTLVQILRWAAHLFILGAALLTLLSHLGVNIAPLLASAGVAGLAISLGAQTLIKDLIGGLLVLIENQYNVGDWVELGGVSGAVEQITLRTTYLRAVNGDLHIVPNGEVRILTNQTKGWSRAQFEVGVAYEENMDRVFQVLRESVAAFAQEAEMAPLLLEVPQIVGPITLGDSAYTMRVTVKTLPGKQLQVLRPLQKWVLETCEREGIDLPYPRQEVWLRSLETGGEKTA